LLHLAQTPQEIMTLMTRYCDSLGALAASWHTELFLKIYSMPLLNLGKEIMSKWQVLVSPTTSPETRCA